MYVPKQMIFLYWPKQEQDHVVTSSFPSPPKTCCYFRNAALAPLLLLAARCFVTLATPPLPLLQLEGKYTVCRAVFRQTPPFTSLSSTSHIINSPLKSKCVTDTHTCYRKSDRGASFSRPSSGFTLVKIISSSLLSLLMPLATSCHFIITFSKKDSRWSVDWSWKVIGKISKFPHPLKVHI